VNIEKIIHKDTQTGVFILKTCKLKEKIMILKLSEVIDLYNVLISIPNNVSFKDRKTSYNIGKLIQKAKPEVNLFDAEMRKIYQKYIEKDEGNNLKIANGQYTIIEGKRADYNKEIEDLSNIEVEIPDCKFKLDDFDCHITLKDKIEEYNLSPVVFAVLDRFIIE
jgi:hypothetical protein